MQMGIGTEGLLDLTGEDRRTEALDVGFMGCALKA